MSNKGYPICVRPNLFQCVVSEHVLSIIGYRAAIGVVLCGSNARVDHVTSQSQSRSRTGICRLDLCMYVLYVCMYDVYPYFTAI